MPAKNTRLTSLDGLRGVAALVVLLHHSLLTIPALTNGYYGDHVTGTLPRLLTYSPVHIVWAGTEAVYLFFLLSGFVLALPGSRGERDWGRYYPSRLARLYLPVWAAIVFGLVTTLIVKRTGQNPSQWVNDHNSHYGLHSILGDGVLIGGISGVLTQLWSLEWEVLFSLLLPLYLFLSNRFRARWIVLASLVLIVVGSLGTNGSLTYLPMFGLGVGLAKAWPSVLARAERLNARPWQWVFWLVVGLVSVVLTTVTWLGGPASLHVTEALRVVAVVGTFGFVLLGALSPAARAVLTLPPVRLLGTISFSLYLIHEPIVVALAYLLPHTPQLAIPVAVFASLALAWVFHRFVEEPVQALARRIGRSGPVVMVDDPEQMTGATPEPADHRETPRALS